MMQMIFIDARDYASPRQMHESIAMMLDFPAHYGCNADALNDCLGELAAPVNVVVSDMGDGDIAAALETCLRVFRDQGGKVTVL